MGSPISGLIAEAVMQRLENTVLPLLEIKLWVRYVDDTFVILKRSKLEETHHTLNNVFAGIEFTREEEENGKLPFLDVLVQRLPNGQLETTVYRKQKHTDQILNFGSNHPLAHKRSCIKTLFRRARTHCSTIQLRKTEEKHLFEAFMKNGYPKNFILRCLASKPRRNTQQLETKKQTLPYIENTSEMAARILLPLGITIAHKPTSTLRME